MIHSYIPRHLLKERIESKHLSEDRYVRIYLPSGYNELISYPVIYAQDGQDVFMYGRIATIANYLLLEQGMEPIIIVGVHVDKKHRTEEYHAKGARNEAYKLFFKEELLPYIEDRFSIRPEMRLLLGDSLGASVSLDLVLDYPKTFSKMISLSGAFFEQTLRRLQQTSDLSWLHLWMGIGTEETAVQTHLGSLDFLAWNRKIRQVLEDKHAQLTYMEQKGQHIWGFWQNILPTALLHFFNHN